jgi:gliding motility-associated-like protein
MKLIYTLLLFAISLVGLAQPANDDCSGAQSLGSLPAPVACPGSGLGGTVTVAGTLNGATPGNPYVFQNTCSGSAASMASPALDVWYSFVATGYQVTLKITGAVVNPNIALYSGTCGALGGGIGGCTVGTGAGAATLVVNQMVIGTTYLVQISGNSAAGGGNFSLSASNSISCTDCMTASTLTVNPPPVNGAYAPGTTVNFCYHVDKYAEINTNWLHGVQLSFGSGWNAASLVTSPATPLTTTCAGNKNSWKYYPGGATSNNNGSVWPAGWYYEDCTGDGNPGNNFGDDDKAGTALFTVPAGAWNFCFSLTTKPVCSPGSDLSVTINTSGDGESGNWNNLGCLSDPPSIATAVGACCAPTMASTPTCSGQSTGTATATPVGANGPFVYSWDPGGQTTQTATALTAGTYTVYVTDKNLCQISNTVVVGTNPSPTATTTPGTELCFGGSTATASVLAAGGTGAYTYAWAASGGTAATTTALPSGSYTCTITDNKGCTVVKVVAITDPPVLTATGTPGAALCNGGTATVSVSPTGGTGAYTYAWAAAGGTGQTSTALPAGSYTCTITDHNGCNITQVEAVSEPSLLTATGSPGTILCNGGTATVSVSPTGGTGAYTYAWAAAGGTGQTSTALPVGTYTCTITDHNGCHITQVESTTGPTALTATNSQTNILCHGGSTGVATVFPSGGTGAYTYAWSPSGGTAASATGLAAASYICTIKDNNGCTITSGVTLTQPGVINLSTTTVSAACGAANGTATATATGGAGGFTYTWTPSGGSAATTTGVLAGTYTITVNDANLCPQSTTQAISNSGGPTAVISGSTNILCHGGNTGSATVLASGGFGAYTYSWAPSGGTAATANSLTAGAYTVTVSDNNGCQTTASVTITEPAALVITNAKVDVTCFGGNSGSASVNASTGTAPYTYSWAPSGGTAFSATGLVAGNYTCTITDHNGCPATSVVVVGQPVIVSGTIIPVNELCNGASTGSATVTPAGGTGAYTFSWSPSGGTAATASALAANTYTCTITDANACSHTATTTISQPPVIGLTTSSVSSTCGAANGTASVVATGGTGTLTYSWAPSGGAATTTTPVLAGIYTISVTDANSCSKSTTVTISNSGGPTASISASTNVSCNGGANGSATVTATGGVGAYTFSWTPTGGTAATATGLSAITYTCTVTDNNGCPNTTTILITQPAPLTATNTQTNVSCNGGSNGSASVTASGGSVAYTYAWAPSGGAAATATTLAANTYVCTITDAHACSTTSSVTITQPLIITASNTLVNVKCNGGSDGSATATASGGTGTLSYSWTPSGGAAASATGLSANTYTCTVSDANACASQTTATITQPAVLGGATTFTASSCGLANGTATANPTGGTGAYTYSWNPGGTTTQTSTALLAGLYSCTITDANLCKTVLAVTVPDQAGPTVGVTGLTNVGCNGACNGSVSVTAAGGTGAYTYSWSPLGGIAATASSLCPNVYTCTVTDANGCSSSTNANVIQSNPIVVTIPVFSNVLCNGGNTGSATASAFGGTGTLSYVWTPTGGNTAAATGLAAGLYTVTVKDVNGCLQKDTITIHQPAPLTISVAGLSTTCNGKCDGTLICIPAGGIAPYTYSWSTGCTAASCNNVCAGPYTLTVNDGNGCTVSGATTVAQPTPIILSMFTQTAHCLHSDGTDSVFASGGTITYSYSWSPGIGASTPAYHNIAPGMYVVTVTDKNNCVAKDSMQVPNAPGVVANIVGTTPVTCFGGKNGAAQGGGTGGTLPYAYSWAPGTSVSDTAQNLTAGTYAVTVTDGKGCKNTAVAIITQPTPVVATPMPAMTLCIGQCLPLTSTGSGGTPNYSYAWTTTAGPAAMPVCPLVTTTYTVIATDKNGCVSVPAPLLITVNPPLVVVATHDTAMCPGGTTSLLATASGGNGNYSYTWSTALGLSSSTVSNPTASPATTTVYTVTLTDNCGTPSTQSTATVTIYPAPIAVFAASDTLGCMPLCIRFNEISSPACASAVWDFGDGITENGCSNISHCYAKAGLYSVTMNEIDIHGCSAVTSRPNYINVFPIPHANFKLGPQPATIVNSDITFTDLSTGAVSWVWNFGDLGGASSILQNPNYVYPDTGCFTSMQIVTNTFGCVDTAYRPLCIRPDFTFYAPNAFTPNGDGVNDLWSPKGLGIDPATYHLMMFDRWGNLMWETRTWGQGWDGRANNGNGIAQIDTYIWKVDLADYLANKHAFNGVCNLIR